MGLFGFGKKKEGSAPACACQCGCPTAEVDVSEAAKDAASAANGALSIKVLGAGCASWGTHADIEPYTDPVFQNNVILTKTECLTMNSRPKDPKTARNKNVLIVGGSGSGKTRFWIKPSAPVGAV